MTVVSLPGSSTLPPGEACSQVIELLQDWLAKAERGEFRHILIAGVKPGFAGTTTAWAGIAGPDDCLAAATGLFTRMQAAWLESISLT